MSAMVAHLLGLVYVVEAEALDKLHTAAWIDKEARKEFKNQGVPSDHAPVLATFRDDP